MGPGFADNAGVTGLPSIRILLVEDSVAQSRFLQQTLRDLPGGASVDVFAVGSLADAMTHLQSTTVDLVLLDLVLPDSDGFETFEAVHGGRPDIPVIVLSGAGDETIAMRAVAGGAQDYLAKGSLSPELLTRSIRYSLERHRNLEELRGLALRDDLTGINNRRGFLHLAEQQLAMATRTDALVTVLFIDVDRLKWINDTHGHAAGDVTLVDIANVMRSTFRASDVIGRIGGDEFAVLLLDHDDAPAAARAVARFDATLAAHNRAAERPFDLACTVGSAVQKATQDLTIDALLSAADHDMYESREGRSPISTPHARAGGAGENHESENT